MTDTPKCRVLLVEDTQLNQMLGKAMLEHCGCRVDVAANGREALEALDRQRYDLVFMDCQMPVMDGFEAAAAIRTRESGGREGRADRRVPIVALTAYDSDQDREQCRLSGMDDYIGKPFTLATLERIIARWYTPGRPAAGSFPDGKNMP